MQIRLHLRIARDIHNQAHAMVADQVWHIGSHGNPKLTRALQPWCSQDHGLQCRRSQSTGFGAADLTARGRRDLLREWRPWFGRTFASGGLRVARRCS